MRESNTEGCPSCGTKIDQPQAFHGGGNSGRQMHTHRECPSCGRLLVWFKQDDDSPLDPGWRIDENEERIQRYRKGGD